MGFRFRRSIKLAPGLRLNVSKSGVSMSAGLRGASVSMGKNGVYGNVGVPGTGVSYRKRLDSSSGGSRYSDGARSSASSLAAYRDFSEVCLKLKGDLRCKLCDENHEPLPSAEDRYLRREYRSDIIAALNGLCEECNEPLEAIQSLHLHTPSPADSWMTLDFYPAFEGAVPEPPSYEVISWVDYLFYWRKGQKKVRNQERETRYHKRLEDWQQSVDQYEAEQQAQWDARLSTHESQEEFLEKMIGRIDWPRETQVCFKLSEDQKTVWLDTDLPEIEDMPGETFRVVERGLRLKAQPFSATQLRVNYLRHVHGVGFRLIGEVFRALPVERVVFSGFTQRSDAATGHIQDDYLYSVQVERADWSNINFGNLSSLCLAEVMNSFTLRRNMTKTGIFQAVEPFTDTEESVA